jgi:hypothetical protein
MAVLGATNLTGCNSIPDFIAGGTLALFKQTTAPTSWVKQTTHNNKTLRVVSGAAGSGGVTAFSSVFPSAATVPISDSQPIGNTVGSTTLTTPQIPAHTHPLGTTSIQIRFNPGPGTRRTVISSGNAGGNGAHDHPWGGTASFSTSINLRVRYVDLIICSKS